MIVPPLKVTPSFTYPNKLNLRRFFNSLSDHVTVCVLPVGPILGYCDFPRCQFESIYLEPANHQGTADLRSVVIRGNLTLLKVSLRNKEQLSRLVGNTQLVQFECCSRIRTDSCAMCDM